MKLLSLNYTFNFGQYKGEVLDDVIKANPEYVEWCVANIGWFELDDEATKKLERRCDKEYDMTWYQTWDTYRW